MAASTLEVLLDPGQLPSPPKPVGNYVAVLRHGDLLYTSGMIPLESGQLKYTGAIGGLSVGIEQGQAAAKLCVLNGLSAIYDYLGGSFEALDRVVKVTGFVQSAPGFYQQPKVMNGASDTLVEWFGEAGKHVRSAVGVSALPLDASVEVELVVALKT